MPPAGRHGRHRFLWEKPGTSDSRPLQEGAYSGHHLFELKCHNDWTVPAKTLHDFSASVPAPFDIKVTIYLLAFKASEGIIMQSFSFAPEKICF